VFKKGELKPGFFLREISKSLELVIKNLDFFADKLKQKGCPESGQPFL
jgi:hypothetical protein